MAWQKQSMLERCSAAPRSTSGIGRSAASRDGLPRWCRAPWRRVGGLGGGEEGAQAPSAAPQALGNINGKSTAP